MRAGLVLSLLLRVVGGTLVCCSAVASPMQYGYSYTFNNGTVVAGTLTGQVNGAFLENVADITLSVNGTSQSGPFYLYGRDAGGAGWLPTAGRVAFDGSLNNLLFANDPPPLDGPSEYFYYLNTQQWCGAASSCTLVSIENPHFDASDVGASASRWVLQATPVPEPATLALLSFGLAGLAASRRRKQ